MKKTLALALLLAMATPAFSWNDKGQMVVAEIRWLQRGRMVVHACRHVVRLGP